jgi:uncharacterized phiE125 gp8 family phage protein
MILRRIGSAATPPVTLAEAKAHLRVTDTAENDLITALVAAACAAVGEESGRTLATETWEIADHGFDGLVKLPKSPVLALTSVKYYVDDTLTTATLADYRLYLADDYTHVGPVELASWPISQTRPDGTVIRFTAGYSSLPVVLKHAVLLTVGHWFANREAVTVGAMSELPRAAEHLISLERLGWAGA